MNMMTKTALIICFVFSRHFLFSEADKQYVDRKFVKCLVCQIVINELNKEIMNVDPSLQYKGGSYVLEEYENTRLNVELRKSDIYLVELMDNICKRMDEFVRVFNKSSGLLEVIPLIVNGKMNPALSEYEIIKDGDLESLQFYCDSIISEYEEELIKMFKNSERDIYHKICFSTQVCMNFDPGKSLNNEL